MPLTNFQSRVALLLSKNRSEDSHLAGGAALHFAPQSIRYSLDLDYFHDTEQRVASAFQADRKTLQENHIQVEIEMNQPGYIRCIVQLGNEVTKVEWAQDSSWRFMPVQWDQNLGFVLHPIDLAINKLLALAGRDEPRDFLDVHHTHDSILPLGAQCWAACGKDPGFNPLSLLDLIRRRGKYHQSDFDRLHLVRPVDLQKLKINWLKMLESAETFIRKAPAENIGCLYYSFQTQSFFEPNTFPTTQDSGLHYGKPGGVLPKVI